MTDYVGEHTQIGRGTLGMRPVAQNGQVRIEDGVVRLLGTDGASIAEAPVRAVTAERGRGIAVGIVWVTLDDTRYSLAIEVGGIMLLTGLLRLLKGSSSGKRFLAALDAARTDDAA
jgi:hypothetical protein